MPYRLAMKKNWPAPSKAARRLPIAPGSIVRWEDERVRPVGVEDVVRLFEASLSGGQLSRQTVAVMGPERLRFSEVVRRVAKAADRRVYVFPMPVWFHKALAWVFERVMKIPLI